MGALGDAAGGSLKERVNTNSFGGNLPKFCSRARVKHRLWVANILWRWTSYLNAVAEIESVRPIQREAVGPIHLDRGNNHPPSYAVDEAAQPVNKPKNEFLSRSRCG